ncbi:MAG: 4-oxalocrotonate tautomerase family protein [Selenomonadaceae bacterium]|nr:4-oxalocrotonate tautomerase family protein [Selenomonadaceae bacterium]
MPIIQLEAAKVSKEQKEKLIADLTRVASENLGVPEEYFYVLIKENDLDNWGVGGKTLTKFLEEHKK